MFKIPDQPNSLLEEGTWTEYQGARFLIAHAGNTRFQRAVQRLQKPFRRKIERNEMDPADQKNIMTKAMAEALVRGWEGVATEFSQDAALKLLRNDEAFRDFVMEFSMDLQNFREEELEHEGNS